MKWEEQEIDLVLRTLHGGLVLAVNALLASFMILCSRVEWSTSFFACPALRPRACLFSAGVWPLRAKVRSQRLKSERTYSSSISAAMALFFLVAAMPADRPLSAVLRPRSMQTCDHVRASSLKFLLYSNRIRRVYAHARSTKEILS